MSRNKFSFLSAPEITVGIDNFLQVLFVLSFFTPNFYLKTDNVFTKFENQNCKRVHI